MNWQCICGNFVKEKRFCPRCKILRFSIENSPILDYWGERLGTLSDGLQFNFPLDLLANHVLVSGQTGTGKSRFAMNLTVKTANSVQNKIKVLVLDVEGEWKNIIPLIKGDVEYYAVDRNLKINPFDLKDPALVRELLRQTIFKGIEKEYLDLSAQMNFVLQETISQSNNLQELIDNIKSYDKQRLTGLDKTKTALLVRLDPFMRSPLREIFLCKKSNPSFDNLDEKNVVIDLHELDALVAYGSEVRLIYNILTSYYLRKMLGREIQYSVKNLLVADEAQLLVPKILQKLIITESWPATEFATRLRKRGCGLMLITQSPSNIEQDIFKNCATKVTFRLQSKEDIKLVSESAGFFDYVEMEYLSAKFVQLPKKHAIVNTINHEPFLIKSDDVSFGNFIPLIKDESEVPQNSEFDQDEKEFMASIDNNPYFSVYERRTSLGWNDKKFVRIVDGMLAKKAIERLKAPLGRGSPRILFQRKGQIPSVIHEFYVSWISEKLSAQGLEVRKSGVGPDIEIPQLGAAIEVELGDSNISGNLKRNQTEFKHVIICTESKKLLENLSKIKSKQVSVLPVHKVPAFVEKMKAGDGFLNC